MGPDPTGLTFRPARAAEVAQGPELFPSLAQGFEAIGFRRVGAVVEDLPPDGLDALVEGFEPEAEAGYRRWVGVPSTALASPDGTALALIGWFWDTPIIELSSVLTDGRPASTRSPWQVDPPWPVAIQRYWKFTDRRREQLYDDMPGRSIEIAGEVDPADLWTAHRAHLARLADSTAPITVEGYCAMRNAAHEALCRTVDRMNRLAIALMAAACVLSFAVGVAVGVRSGTGWLAAVTGLVCLVLLVPLSRRLSWVLRHVRRLRAPYPLGTQA